MSNTSVHNMYVKSLLHMFLHYRYDFLKEKSYPGFELYEGE